MWLRFQNRFLNSISSGQKIVTLRPWKESFAKLMPGDDLILAIGGYNSPILIDAKIQIIEKLPISNSLPERIISADCCPVKEILDYLKSKKTSHFAAIWFRVSSPEY